jgi:hypothetical protein
MRKKHHRIFLLLLLIAGVLYTKTSNAQNLMAVNVKFEIDGKTIDFANDVKLVININREEIEPLMFVNGFIVPDFKEAKEVDVCFIHKGNRYLFKGLPVSKFETNWIFGIVKKPSDKRNKKEYYMKFNPKDGGDGTQVTITQ